MPPASAAITPALQALAQRRRQRWGWRGLTLSGLTLGAVTAGWLANEGSARSFADGLPHLGDFFSAYLPDFDPDALFADAETTGSLARWTRYWIPYTLKMLETLNVALLATLLAFLFAVPLAALACDRYAHGPTSRILARRLLEALRSIPELVIALILLYALGLYPIVAAIALTLHATGALGKLFAEVMDSAPSQPVEALTSTGARWSQQIRFGVLPQVLPDLLSFTLLRLEINVRSSTILGFVGAGGFGRELSTRIQSGNFSQAFFLITLLILTILLIDSASAWIRRHVLQPQQAEA